MHTKYLNGNTDHGEIEPGKIWWPHSSVSSLKEHIYDNITFHYDVSFYFRFEKKMDRLLVDNNNNT